MKKAALILTLFGLGAMTALGQQSNSYNSSRSNIKNNIEVGPDGKVHCTVTTGGKPLPCGSTQIASFNAGLKASTGSTVKSVALAKDGSLTCTTATGVVPCSTTHLKDLKQAESRVNSELEQVQASPAQTQK